MVTRAHAKNGQGRPGTATSGAGPHLRRDSLRHPHATLRPQGCAIGRGQGRISLERSVDGLAQIAPYTDEVHGALEVTAAREAVERSYRENGVRIWRALLLFTGDREVANDAVAEAFAQVLRRGEGVRDVDRWVWRAAFHIARAELGERRRHGATLVDSPVEMPTATADLVAALGRLSPKQRGAVILRYFAGYSNREVARIIGSTPGAVGMHLARARAKLRAELEEHDGSG